MPVRRTFSLLGALVLVTACATSPPMTPAERLEFYRANAGDPVRSFHSPARLWGWRALGDSALTVWTSKSQGFLLELANQCPEMAVASSIGLTTRNDQVAAGLDSVVIQRRGGAGSLERVPDRHDPPDQHPGRQGIQARPARRRPGQPGSGGARPAAMSLAAA